MCRGAYFIIRAGNHQEIARSRFFSDKEKMLDAMDFAKTFYAGEESEEISTSKAMLKSSKIKKEDVPFSKYPFRIDIYTESDGDVTQATISGYLGNRIYLKYGIGIEDPISELTVRMYLLNRLWLEVVSGIEQSSDIYYSFDIE